MSKITELIGKKKTSIEKKLKRPLSVNGLAKEIGVTPLALQGVLDNDARPNSRTRDSYAKFLKINRKKLDAILDEGDDNQEVTEAPKEKVVKVKKEVVTPKIKKVTVKPVKEKKAKKVKSKR